MDTEVGKMVIVFVICMVVFVFIVGTIVVVLLDVIVSPIVDLLKILFQVFIALAAEVSE